MITAFVIFPLILILLPGGIGLLFVHHRNKAQVYITGLSVSWSLYEVLTLIFYFIQWPLHVMTLLWLCASVVLAGSGYYRYQKEMGRSQRCPCGNWTRGESCVAILLIALVLVQSLSAALGAYYGNWDDSTYCGIATTSWYTDTVNRYNPNTGEWQSSMYDRQYVLAGWPVFSASLAQLTGMHPAIVFRTILPLFEVPLAYFILYHLARFFFEKSRIKAICTVIVAVGITVVTANQMPQTCAEWWLVINPWTGKAIAGNIMMPMILWILLQIEKSLGTGEQRSWWCSLFFACFASCFVAGTMFFVVPIELAIYGVGYLLRSRRWKDFLKFLTCALPAIICCVVVYAPAIFS